MAVEGVAPRRWGSIAEAALRVGVSRKTIRNWIAAGIIDAERIGPRLIRVDMDSLESVGRPLAVGELGGVS